MNKIIRKKNKNYTVVSNVCVRDNRLSLKAKGLMSLVMSLPNDWDFSIQGLSSIVKEGKSAIYTAINELKDFGYCQVVSNRDDKGKIIGNDYTFFEEPCTDYPYTENQDMDNQDMDNQPQINKDIKEIKTEIIKEKNIDNNISHFSSEKGLFDNDEKIVTMSANNQTNEKENDDAFVDKIYKMYPTKCPVRGVSLGKTHADKKRIKNLLKRYTQEQIEKVVESEVRNKHGKYSMKNFSTFLNNFPDPDGICDNTRPRNNEPVGFHLDEGVRERMREAKEDGSGEW